MNCEGVVVNCASKKSNKTLRHCDLAVKYIQLQNEFTPKH